jgi:CBS domain-containing protein
VSDYPGGKMDWVTNGLLLEDENSGSPRAIDAVSAAPTCGLDATTGEAQAAMDDQNLCVIINKAGIVLGVLRAVDAVGGRPVAQAMRPGPGTFRPGVPARDLARYLREHALTETLLTTADGRLIGMAARRDLESIAGRPSTST